MFIYIYIYIIGLDLHLGQPQGHEGARRQGLGQGPCIDR